jgi:hypothetical protein
MESQDLTTEKGVGYRPDSLGDPALRGSLFGANASREMARASVARPRPGKGCCRRRSSQTVLAALVKL